MSNPKGVAQGCAMGGPMGFLWTSYGGPMGTMLCPRLSQGRAWPPMSVRRQSCGCPMHIIWFIMWQRNILVTTTEGFLLKSPNTWGGGKLNFDISFAYFIGLLDFYHIVCLDCLPAEYGSSGGACYHHADGALDDLRPQRRGVPGAGRNHPHRGARHSSRDQGFD